MTDDSLLARQRVAPSIQSEPPVIVVGVPRSGSSFLSHVISCIENWFVFDDLYLYRHVVSKGIEGPLSADQLDELIHFLGWQLRARLKWDQDFLPLNCTLEEVDRMDVALKETFAGESVSWHELLEEWMVRIALRHGCSNWGYKAPQDFMHIPMLTKLFPGVRFILLVRDPRAYMASSKYLEGEDGDARQYHPLVHARYWRMAQEVTLRYCTQYEAPLHVVQFERLVKEPEQIANGIAEFLGSTLTGAIPQMGANSSFKGRKREGLTDTEKWICERTNREHLLRYGYTLSGSKPKLRDMPDLAKTTWRFALYQTNRVFRQPSARVSVKSFLRKFIAS